MRATFTLLIAAALPSACTVFHPETPCDIDADCPATDVCIAGFCDASVGEGEGESVAGEGEGEGEGEGVAGDGEGEGEGAAEVCGDGALEGAEACDDANGVDGDGCSSACVVESGFACTGAGTGSCADVDECIVDNGGCDAHATCTNDAGSRTCACTATSFTGDGLTCTCTPQPGSLTSTPDVDEDCDGVVDNTTTETRWIVVDTGAKDVGDNGCAYTDLGVVGGPCAACPGDGGCFVDGSGTVVPVCSGGGFGGRSLPGGRVVCQDTTIFH